MVPIEAPQKSKTRPPFRFTALPRELQTYIASLVPFETIQCLSRTCKRTRRVLYPVLFKSINAGHLVSLKKTGVPFPNQALASVQHATFRIDVVSASDKNVGRIRTALALQFGIIHGLSGVPSVKLDIQMARIQDLDDLERPLSMLEASLSALRGIPKEARFDVAIKGHSALGIPVAVPILAALLRPFVDAGLDSLAFDGVLNDMPLSYNWDRDEAYGAYRRIAPKLRELRLQNNPWIAWCDASIPYTALESIHFDHANEVGSGLPRLCGNIRTAVNSCGNRLKEVTINLHADDWEDEDLLLENMNPEPLIYRDVSHLVLRGAAFLLFRDVLQSRYTENLRVNMEHRIHWEELGRLLKSENVGKPKSISLVYLEHSFDSGWEVDTCNLYPEIRDNLTSRGIPLSLHLLGTPDYGLGPFFRCLAEVSAELVEGRFCIPEEAPEDLPLSDFLPEIDLVRLQVLELSFTEGIDIIQESASTCCGPLLSRFFAPELTTLKVGISTPHTHFLQSLIKALWRDAFPKLRRIEGTFGANDYSNIGWQDPIRAHYRGLLVRVCAKRDINLRNLEWQAL